MANHTRCVVLEDHTASSITNYGANECMRARHRRTTAPVSSSLLPCLALLLSHCVSKLLTRPGFAPQSEISAASSRPYRIRMGGSVAHNMQYRRRAYEDLAWGLTASYDLETQAQSTDSIKSSMKVNAGWSAVFLRKDSRNYDFPGILPARRKDGRGSAEAA